MKLTKRILAVVLVMVFALALTACGKKNDIEGTWKLTGGAMIDALVGGELPEGMTLEDLGFVLTFEYKDGDKFAMNMSAMGESETGEGTYKIEDGKITMTVDGDPLTCEYKIDGDTLTLLDVGEFGGDMIFTKSK